MECCPYEKEDAHGVDVCGSFKKSIANDAWCAQCGHFESCHKPVKAPAPDLLDEAAALLRTTHESQTMRVSIKTGWICARCGKSWAPAVMGCVCKPEDEKPSNGQYPPTTESGCAPPLWRLRNTRSGVAVEPYAEIIKPAGLAGADTTLIQKIAQVLNIHSRENGSDTPDFILAEYLTDCLAAWDKSCQSRKNWYAP